MMHEDSSIQQTPTFDRKIIKLKLKNENVADIMIKKFLKWCNVRKKCLDPQIDIPLCYSVTAMAGIQKNLSKQPKTCQMM